MLASVAVPVATAADVVRIFFETAAIYGFPASVLCDNGAIYTAAYRGSHTGMEIELAALGITFKHGKPYHPQTQGKVERYHLTLEEVAAQEAAGGDHGRAPGPDRPLRPHLQRGAPAHRAGLSADAGLAGPRQGHRPSSTGSRCWPTPRSVDDRIDKTGCFTLALPLQAPPRRRRPSAHRASACSS